MKSIQAFVLLVVVSGAQACSCALPESPRAAFAAAKTLVEVEFVADLPEAGERSTKTRFSASFVGLARVVRKWKGSPPPTVRVRMGGPSTCSLLLHPGKRYVLELRDGAAFVSVCSPFLSAQEKVVADFGPGTLVPPLSQGAADEAGGDQVQAVPSYDSVEGQEGGASPGLAGAGDR